MVDTDAKKTKMFEQGVHQDINMIIMFHCFAIYSDMLERSHAIWYQRARTKKYGHNTRIVLIRIYKFTLLNHQILYENKIN